MRHPHHLLGPSLLVLAAVSCYGSSTEPRPMPMDTAPSFVAVVTQVSHNTAESPAGFQLDQYELFVARVPATIANAGLILGPHATAFRARHRSLRPVGREVIAVGDTLSVWADTVRVAYGSVQAPEGAPAYIVDQVVLQH